MDMQTAAETIASDDLLSEARKYITLRDELMERGKRLAELLSRDTVVWHGGAYHALAKTFIPSANELPVSVRPADVLGLIDAGE